MNSGVSEEINKNFLQDFIEGEKYLQNPPMKTDEFIDFCKKRGIQTTKEELEFFEREKLLFPIIRINRPIGEEENIKFRKDNGEEFWRLANGVLQKGETEIERCKIKFYSSYGFSESKYDKELLLDWLREGLLFDPSVKEFQRWESFVGEELRYDRQKIVSFYSSFQIYWLKKIKELNNINFGHTNTDFNVGDCEFTSGNGRVYLEATLKIKIDISEKEVLTLEGGIYKPLDHKKAIVDRFKSVFDLEQKKEHLKIYGDFNKILKFFIFTQSIYFPYVKSGGRVIQISGNEKKWQELRHNFRLDEVLNKLDLKIEDIGVWYKNFSDEAQKILGIERDDWVQLWKNISWEKKDNLEGNIRLGIDYLQWSVMIKEIIEDHLQREILGIDEISNISHDDILKFDPENMDQHGGLLRVIRNKRYSDKDKNYYHDRYKRLFYLSNSFGISYQPRVMVFVEGKTEEEIFSDIFEWYIGPKPENLGIEFVSIEGISLFFGKKVCIKDESGKYLKGFISNLNHLISYNLNKWQIIPYFVGDNENNINFLLQNGISISFCQNPYPFPKEWQYVWGIANSDKPFKGKDFEMANFNDDEIAEVLSEVLAKQIKNSDVKNQRDQNNGIKQINPDVENFKVNIGKKLINSLLDKYKKTKEKTILERPIFKLMIEIENLANLNRPPIDTSVEIQNREYFKNKLKETP
jgi:hypothetical protein